MILKYPCERMVTFNLIENLLKEILMISKITELTTFHKDFKQMLIINCNKKNMQH
jgi:hypothetical protein